MPRIIIWVFIHSNLDRLRVNNRIYGFNTRQIRTHILNFVNVTRSSILYQKFEKEFMISNQKLLEVGCEIIQVSIGTSFVCLKIYSVQQYIMSYLNLYSVFMLFFLYKICKGLRKDISYIVIHKENHFFK